jgi:hypothetical protein
VRKRRTQPRRKIKTFRRGDAPAGNDRVGRGKHDGRFVHTSAELDEGAIARLPAWMTEDLIAQTQRTWQPYYNSPLAREDAVIILRSAGRLFEALAGR